MLSVFYCIHTCFPAVSLLSVTFVRRLFHHVGNIHIKDSCLSFYKRLTSVINMTDVDVMDIL